MNDNDLRSWLVRAQSMQRDIDEITLAAMRPAKSNRPKPKRENRNGPVEVGHVNARALGTARQIAEATGGKVRIIRWGRVEVWPRS